MPKKVRVEISFNFKKNSLVGEDYPQNAVYTNINFLKTIKFLEKHI